MGAAVGATNVARPAPQPAALCVRCHIAAATVRLESRLKISTALARHARGIRPSWSVLRVWSEEEQGLRPIEDANLGARGRSRVPAFQASMSLKSARGREPPARVGACVLVRNRSHEESFITDEQYQPQQMSESRARTLEEKVIVKKWVRSVHRLPTKSFFSRNKGITRVVGS